MAQILIVDDDENICLAFRQFLTELGHTPLIASNAADAERIVAEDRPDLVLMDIRMPGTDGLEALPSLRAIDPDLYVVMMTAYGTAQTSIEAMRLGAFDYLTKPLDLDVVKPLIEKALEAKALSRAVRLEPEAELEGHSLADLVGSSPAMQEIYKRIGLLAGNDAPALVIGERGTGRKLVARTIHRNSRRREHPFASLACRGLSEELLEAELFGTGDGERVGTPGAARSPGALESTRGGTLLIGDVDALPRRLQSQLLGVLVDKRLARAGERTPQPINVRIVATAGRDLAEAVREGRFDGELWDALRVITIEMPPLRERKADIPELVSHFIQGCNAELDTAIRGADPRLLEVLGNHPWPGNVAELANVVKRSCLLARGEVITPGDLGDSLEAGDVPGREEAETALLAAVRNELLSKLNEESGANGSAFHDIVALVEEILLREALKMTSGNQVKAAALLKLNRTTLRKKIQLYNL
jgi:DNA-binding NtrC family response regulator